MISFKTDWFDLLAVQGTLKNLLQHHSLKVSVLLVPCLLYGPALRTVHDRWKDQVLCLVTQSCLTLCNPWTAAHQASLSITSSWSLLKLMSVESVMPCNHLILCHPLLLLPSVFPRIRVFFNESVLCTRWRKYWSFSFSISPSNEYSGPISFRIDWLDLLAVEGNLKSLLQHHGSKASIL